MKKGITVYRATHKEWNCKDDRKLLKCEDPKVKLCVAREKKSIFKAFVTPRLPKKNSTHSVQLFGGS